MANVAVKLSLNNWISLLINSADAAIEYHYYDANEIFFSFREEFCTTLFKCSACEPLCVIELQLIK